MTARTCALSKRIPCARRRRFQDRESTSHDPAVVERAPRYTERHKAPAISRLVTRVPWPSFPSRRGRVEGRSVLTPNRPACWAARGGEDREDYRKKPRGEVLPVRLILDINIRPGRAPWSGGPGPLRLTEAPGCHRAERGRGMPSPGNPFPTIYLRRGERRRVSAAATVAMPRPPFGSRGGAGWRKENFYPALSLPKDGIRGCRPAPLACPWGCERRSSLVTRNWSPTFRRERRCHKPPPATVLSNPLDQEYGAPGGGLQKGGCSPGPL